MSSGGKKRQTAFSSLGSISWTRLIMEEKGVKGVCWFSKYRNDALHVPANILRFLVAIIFAPLYITTPFLFRGFNHDWLKTGWSIEFAYTPEDVLFNAPSGGAGTYEVTGRRPRWLLEVNFINEPRPTITYRQVPWSQATRDRGYAALSYPYSSAIKLYEEAGNVLIPKERLPDRFADLEQRKAVAIYLLHEYAQARARAGIPGGVEYIWLDEFCLSDVNVADELATEEQRKYEVGQLADIYRGATRVGVFCDKIECDHTDLECLWGTRVFTIAEILHTTEVMRLTRIRGEKGTSITELHFETARAFRMAMQTHAAIAQRWHLHAIMQHAANSGAVSWQVAIQALVVEVIRRDEASNFTDHKFLGKVLNGLLPRRSRLEDLRGQDGWSDLAWLLEINQGFYNAAALAAVCNTAGPGVTKHRWLGRPILPRVGNERLQPLVTAFPVTNRISEREVESALCLVGPKTTLLRSTLQRDPAGLHTQEEMQGVKIVTIMCAIVIFIVGIAVAFSNPRAGSGLIWFAFAFYVVIELLVGTIYVVKDEWVVLGDAEWGRNPLKRISRQDPSLTELTNWGDKQLLPRWDDIAQGTYATLVDLRTKVAVRVSVSDEPNAMVAIALHGSGVTCMLLRRDLDDPTNPATKVGMTNVPPYIISQAKLSGTLCVGGEPSSYSPSTQPLGGGQQDQNVVQRQVFEPYADQRGFSPTKEGGYEMGHHTIKVVQSGNIQTAHMRGGNGVVEYHPGNGRMV